MSGPRYYRGGSSLKPRSIDVQVDPDTGLLRTNRGVSVWDRPTGLDQFGGPFEVVSVPPELQIVKAGKRPGHYEIAPTRPMTLDEYEAALGRVVLAPTTA